jgi:hypothetical protein
MRDMFLQHFGECVHQELCSCTHKTSFELHDHSIFYLVDKKPVLVEIIKPASHHITVCKGKDEICLVKTDHCLMPDDVQKCDCVLLDTQAMYFVEIKEGKKRGQLRNGAVSQLGATIQLFRDKSIIPQGHKVQAIMGLPTPANKIPQASEMTRRELFKRQHGVDLLESDILIFN